VPTEGGDAAGPEPLTGTTYRVYRYMFKAGGPVGIYDIQRGLKLSSPSVAQYHVKKLLQMGLVKEEGQGYVVDKVVFDNVIRIRRVAIPVQVGYIAFFAVLLGALLTLLRPSVVSSVYFVAVISSVTALIIFVQQAVRTLRRVG
jgi:DNA-binding transcriptional ArsR family regulator